jgi:hypothetical protein
MPVLAAVAIVLLLVPLVVALMPLSLFLRYRAGTARRRGRSWVAALNIAALLLSAALFLLGAAVTNIWVPQAFLHAAAGMGAGCVLGFIGLRASRWEPTSEGLHYTPNRWLVLGVTLLVTARIAFGLWRGWHAWRAASAHASWVASFGIAGSLAAGAVVLGYYLMYWVGLWRRIGRHREDVRERGLTA